MPIQKLSPLIANQIAAGEVVERPASVVKELLENSVDAGANRIQIDIERGGIRLIRITDNGDGIPKSELALALARHATSKILAAKDLEAIDTLGFRGEALASISSVSRLTLSSKPEEQEIGWSAYAEGSEMEVRMQPHPLPFGSIVEVKDLFFNTPARQKFLKAERTEFVHIEEVVKKTALANPQVAMTLKHNAKVVKRIPAANSKEQIKQRVGAILGRTFINKAIPLNSQLEDIQLSGWLSPVDYHQSSSLSQYFFVNGRPVKDRTINHAVRQVYQELLPIGRSPAYLLYLNLPAKQVDVNVHPTKHEVRFTEPRRVHDYIIKALETCLKQQESVLDTPGFKAEDREQTEMVTDYAGTTNQATVFETGAHYSQANFSVQEKPSYYQAAKSKLLKSRGLWLNRFYLEESDNALWLLDLQAYLIQQITNCLKAEWQQSSRQLADIKQRPLLIPVRLQLTSEAQTDNIVASWQLLGFDLAQAGPSSLIVRKVPSCVEHLHIETWLKQAIVESNPSNDVTSWQQRLTTALASAWQPEPKTNWIDYLNSHPDYESWQASKYSLQLQAQDLAQLLKGQ